MLLSLLQLERTRTQGKIGGN